MIHLEHYLAPFRLSPARKDEDELKDRHSLHLKNLISSFEENIQ